MVHTLASVFWALNYCSNMVAAVGIRKKNEVSCIFFLFFNCSIWFEDQFYSKISFKSKDDFREPMIYATAQLLCSVFPEDFNKLCSVPMVIPERPGYPPPPLGPVPPVHPVPPGFPPGPPLPAPRPPVEYPYPSREPPSKNSKVTWLSFLR